jgi:PRTRC genetic system ThiF family protein
MTHSICPHLMRRRSIRVAVIGCGGNGCVIAMGLPYIHQALVAAGHPGGLDVTLIDGDTISPSNCVRQPFSVSEVGLNKSVVLASRINLFWGLRWKAAPNYLAGGLGIENADLVITCVDTRAARATANSLVAGNAGVSYWLDLGNNADSGQFVLGQPWNRLNPRRAYRLRTAAELFPEIVDLSFEEDNAPSCSALEAIEHQRLFVNQVLASHALALLASLFRSGELTVHGAFVNSSAHHVQPILIDRAVWRRLSRPRR